MTETPTKLPKYLAKVVHHNRKAPEEQPYWQVRVPVPMPLRGIFGKPYLTKGFTAATEAEAIGIGEDIIAGFLEEISRFDITAPHQVSFDVGIKPTLADRQAFQARLEAWLRDQAQAAGTTPALGSIRLRRRHQA